MTHPFSSMHCGVNGDWHARMSRKIGRDHQGAMRSGSRGFGGEIAAANKRRLMIPFFLFQP